MQSKINERDVMRGITDYLSMHGVFWWRNNTGAYSGIHNGRKRFFRFGATGSGDIFALAGGQFISIEVKAPGKKPSPAQVAWIERVQGEGGLALWVDDVRNFIEWFEREVE